MQTIKEPTILARLKQRSRERLEQIAQQCVVVAIPMSQLRAMANEGLGEGHFLYSNIYGRTPLERLSMVNCVMRDIVAPMPFKELCAWVKSLADKDELEEVLGK